MLPRPCPSQSYSLDKLFELGCQVLSWRWIGHVAALQVFSTTLVRFIFAAEHSVIGVSCYDPQMR